jgi:hypothetical protein
MLEAELVTVVTQFGMAGLIAWMWLSERRSGAQREKQIVESHDRLMEQRVEIDALVTLVGDNARAMASLEAGQRRIAALIERALGPVDAGEHRAAV